MSRLSGRSHAQFPVSLALWLAFTGVASGSEHGAEPRVRLAQAASANSPTVARPGAAPRPIYVPPTRGAPAVRVVAGTRGARQGPRIALMAPDHTGHTSSPQPRLYWYAYRAIDEPVSVLVVDDTQIDPLLEMDLVPPLRAGVHVLDLAALDVTLDAGREYLWSVAIVHDPRQRSRDTFAEGSITRVASPSPAAPAAPRAGRPQALAQAGLWYDAVDEIARLIADGEQVAHWRAMRRALLEQVGVELPPPAGASP